MGASLLVLVSPVGACLGACLLPACCFGSFPYRFRQHRVSGAGGGGGGDAPSEASG